MIEEVVNSILQAEDVAKERVAEENAKAAAAENKRHYQQVIADAEQSASEQSAELLSRLNAESDKEIEKFRANKQMAVNIILENL